MTEGLAAGEGFEPSQTESESGVLPLHKPAKRIDYYTHFGTEVKNYFFVFLFLSGRLKKPARNLGCNI